MTAEDFYLLFFAFAGFLGAPALLLWGILKLTGKRSQQTRDPDNRPGTDVPRTPGERRRAKSPRGSDFRFAAALHSIAGSPALPRGLPLLLAALLLGVAPAVAQQMVSVRDDNTNWRSGPGTQYPVEWILERGYPLSVIATRGNWLHVRDFERDEGWISRPLTSSERHSIVKVKTAHLRNRPTTGSRIIARLGYGEILKMLEDKAEWVKVRRKGGLRGWVARRLLWGW